MALHDLKIGAIGSIVAGIITLVVFNMQWGYRNDEGALLEGTLVDYNSTVLKRNYQPIAMVDGKLQAVSTWMISYVDKNGKVGRCRYVTLSGTGGLMINEHVKCYTGEIEFN